MIKFSGSIHQLPLNVKGLISLFIIVLSFGFYGGLFFVNNTTNFKPSGIEERYLGNENNEQATKMLFKKSKAEVLTIIHSHVLSMSLIFLIIGFILSLTSIAKNLKHFLMYEPFLSVLLTFGGIYVIWSGITWFKYIILLSGILMTLSFTLSVILIFYQMFFFKVNK